MPLDQTVSISPDNKIMEKPSETRDADVEREFQCSILMDINTAKLIAQWINQKVDEFEALKK